MNITIYGSGYVGLVTGTCFAELGHKVLCVDINPIKISQLKKGICPFYEPGLEALLQQNIAAGRLLFTDNPDEAVKHGFYHFIAVATPAATDGAADLSYVFNVARSIGQNRSEDCIVINKSTVPIGTAEKVSSLIQEQFAKRKISIDFDVVSNPEFLREGCAINDFMRPDRVIIGANNFQSAQKIADLYAPLNLDKSRIVTMKTRAAELTKYTANAFLAAKISFMNELSQIAERANVDVKEVQHGIALDHRIGPHFINPGCGYGGSCFPKDVSALISIAQQLDFDPQLLQAVQQVNQRQKENLFEKIHHHFKGNLKNKVIALWGLAFKPETDDMREAPSRVLLEKLWQQGAKVQAFDPAAQSTALELYSSHSNLTLCQDMYSATLNADGLAIVTEWNIFTNPDWEILKTNLTNSVIFDGRNIYDPPLIANMGFTYYAIGRGQSLYTESQSSYATN